MNKITLGILGGGQLGRMSAIAAARLGIEVMIYTDRNDDPASQVASKTIVSDYKDEKTLESFAKACGYITYEFENIPIESVEFLQKIKPVYPNGKLLATCQDRVAEKKFLNDNGIETARWKSINTPQEAIDFINEINANEIIIKTRRFGYDGKGQARVSADTASDAFKKFQNHDLIAEEIIDFKHELSVIVARDKDGNMQSYGPMLNDHKNHILHRTITPAPFSTAISKRAIEKAQNLANAFKLRGVLCLEMFLTSDQRILANEIAPRTHNSGHWTIDACAVSQFENHVRAVCGLPLGSSEPHSGAEMINLIGDDVNDIQSSYIKHNHCIHLYGKTDIKPGRKMGHITILKDL